MSFNYFKLYEKLCQKHKKIRPIRIIFLVTFISLKQLLRFIEYF